MIDAAKLPAIARVDVELPHALRTGQGRPEQDADGRARFPRDDRGPVSRPQRRGRAAAFPRRRAVAGARLQGPAREGALDGWCTCRSTTASCGTRRRSRPRSERSASTRWGCTRRASTPPPRSGVRWCGAIRARSISTIRRSTIDSYQQLAAYARGKGIKVVVENQRRHVGEPRSARRDPQCRGRRVAARLRQFSGPGDARARAAAALPDRRRRRARQAARRARISRAACRSRRTPGSRASSRSRRKRRRPYARSQNSRRRVGSSSL